MPDDHNQSHVKCKKPSVLAFAICCAAIGMLTATISATAANQRDWNDCKASDPDISIPGCTRILEGKETVRNRQAAYTNLGNAWYGKGDFDRAIGDYSESIWLAPLDFTGHLNRARAWFVKGNVERALLDYNETIRLIPSYPGSDELAQAVLAYISRGIVHLYNGQVSEALADYAKASALAPKSPYAVLWLDIARRRSNLPSVLSSVSSNLDMTKWPAPIVRLFLGELEPSDVLAAADDQDVGVKQGNVCEANFYTGELVLQTGTKEQATTLFRLAVADCPKLFIEWSAAVGQIRALDLLPSSSDSKN